MTKIIFYGGLILGIAAMMAFSSVPMIFAPEPPDGAPNPNPVLAFYNGDDCLPTREGQVCVANDNDRDGICDSPPFIMQITAAQAAGVNGRCVPSA